MFELMILLVVIILAWWLITSAAVLTTRLLHRVRLARATRMAGKPVARRESA